MDDKDLMILFQKQSDKIAFERLYHKHKLPLLSFAFAHVRNSQVAEELVHETFLKVYRFKEKYDPEKTFKTWLWTICKNTCLDQIRKSSSIKETNIDDYLFELSDNEDEILNQLITKATQEEILNNVDKLGLDQKNAILLWMNDELTFLEIGEILNRTEGAAKNLVQRAKANLKNLLGETYDRKQQKSS